MRRLFLLLGCFAAPALAADPPACLDQARKYDATRSDLGAIEISLTLFAATNAGCRDLVGRLLDDGASPAARDRLGARPLHRAARFGHAGVVDLLLARGAELDARDLAGRTALFNAVEAGHSALAQALVARGADVTLAGRSGLSTLAVAAARGDAPLMRALLAAGAPVERPDTTGKTALVYAAAFARQEAFDLLFRKPEDAQWRGEADLTLLMWAAGPDKDADETQALAIVARLVEAGAPLDAQDARGRTALMIAAEGGRRSIQDFLLARGADARLRDRDGKTAQDFASAR